MSGRTSVLVTNEIPGNVPPTETIAFARELLARRRFAEAYELLSRLMSAGVAVETCARELAWICEGWNRVAEAETLRERYRIRRGEQMSLW